MLSITGKIVLRLTAVGFTTEMLPVKQGFYLFIPGVSVISQFLCALFISYWLLKKLSSAVFKLNLLSALLRDLTGKMTCDMCLKSFSLAKWVQTKRAEEAPDPSSPCPTRSPRESTTCKE